MAACSQAVKLRNTRDVFFWAAIQIQDAQKNKQVEHFIQSNEREMLQHFHTKTETVIDVD